MRQIYILFILVTILIPVSVIGNTDTAKWLDILNRAITSGGTPQGFDANNVQLQSGDRELLGLNNDAKIFLQSRSNKPESHVKGLNTDFANRLANLFKAAERNGYRLSIYSGYRSIPHQAALFKRAVAKYGSESAARKYVAPPGKSRHNYGRAVDLKFSSKNAERWVHRNTGQYGLRFPMSWEPWHIEPRGSVRKDTQVASNTPNNGDSSEQNYRPSESEPQNNNQAQNAIGTGGNGGGSNNISPNNNTSTKGGNNTQQKKPKSSIWDLFKREKKVTTLSCAKGEIDRGERVLIKWSCGDDSTSSRGGTTRKESRFNTKGRLSGGGYASPRQSIKYKVQCLAEKKVTGEAICSIKVNNSINNDDTEMSLLAESRSVEWGASTILKWRVEDATKCTLKGGDIDESGITGSVNTGRLFNSTVYVLQCDLPNGSKMKKIEVGVR